MSGRRSEWLGLYHDLSILDALGWPSADVEVHAMAELPIRTERRLMMHKQTELRAGEYEQSLYLLIDESFR